MPEPFADWSEELRAELDALTGNPMVGTALLLDDEHTRIWGVRLSPGQRIPFHRHVLDYVWTCVTGGTARSHNGEGETLDVVYTVSQTSRRSFGAGESMIHDFENTGDADLVFTTFEYLDSANAPLPLTAP